MNFHKTDDYLTEATCVGTAFDGGKFVSRGMPIPSKAVAPKDGKTIYMAMDQHVCHCLELNGLTTCMRQTQFQAVQSTVTTETRCELS